MTRPRRRRPERLVTVAAALIPLWAAGCDEPEAIAPPAPAELTRDDLGYYCDMIVADHPGPKGQIFLTDRDKPIWFSSVRDTVTFTLLPEEPKNIAAIYVNDMGRAASWAAPGPGDWIEARDAWYVIESDRRGGMGAPELVPFGEEAAAKAFARRHGGRIVRYDGLPRADLLAPVDEDTPPAEHAAAAASARGR